MTDQPDSTDAEPPEDEQPRTIRFENVDAGAGEVFDRLAEKTSYLSAAARAAIARNTEAMKALIEEFRKGRSE